VLAATGLMPHGKLAAWHAAVTIDREVSLPFTPTAHSGTPRPGGHAENTALQLRVAALLGRQADDIAARWEREAAGLAPELSAADATDAAGPNRPTQPVRAVALLRALASFVADDGGSANDLEALGLSIGASAFDGGAKAHHPLLALDLLEGLCFEAVEGTWDGAQPPLANVTDALRTCRRLRQAVATAAAAATRGYADAASRALQERFRRLRHDLRNPIGTIQSALSLMADETVPEDARRSPRFRAMIERNAATLDQMVVTRLSDAEARAASTPPAVEPGSAPLVVDEPRDDLARSRQRDDRQAGSF